MSEKVSRRDFLKVITAAVVAAPVCSTIIKPKRVYALDVPKVAVDPESAKAKQFGYHEDASKVDVTKYPKRAGAEGEKQLCSNCQLLTQSGLKAEGKEEAYGFCTLFTEGLVAEKGWCNMWVQKV